MITSLLYLITNKPDIMFSVHLCERFEPATIESQWRPWKDFLNILLEQGTLVYDIQEVVTMNYQGNLMLTV